MHRNINPDDVTFDQSGHVVISNFEFAEFVASSWLNTGTFSCDFLTYPRAQCYQAPEILLGWAHDSVVDSWGFGMVLYFMYFGKVSRVLFGRSGYIDSCPLQHPFKIGAGPEGSEDLQARIIEGTLSPDSLRLIHFPSRYVHCRRFTQCRQSPSSEIQVLFQIGNSPMSYKSFMAFRLGYSNFHQIHFRFFYLPNFKLTGLS